MCKTDNSLLAWFPLAAKVKALYGLAGILFMIMKVSDYVHLHIVYIFTSALNKDISAKTQ